MKTINTIAQLTPVAKKVQMLRQFDKVTLHNFPRSAEFEELILNSRTSVGSFIKSLAEGIENVVVHTSIVPSISYEDFDKCIYFIIAGEVVPIDSILRSSIVDITSGPDNCALVLSPTGIMLNVAQHTKVINESDYCISPCMEYLSENTPMGSMRAVLHNTYSYTHVTMHDVYYVANINPSLISHMHDVNLLISSSDRKDLTVDDYLKLQTIFRGVHLEENVEYIDAHEPVCTDAIGVSNIDASIKFASGAYSPENIITSTINWLNTVAGLLIVEDADAIKYSIVEDAIVNVVCALGDRDTRKMLVMNLHRALELMRRETPDMDTAHHYIMLGDSRERECGRMDRERAGRERTERSRIRAERSDRGRRSQRDCRDERSGSNRRRERALENNPAVLDEVVIMLTAAVVISIYTSGDYAERILLLQGYISDTDHRAYQELDDLFDIASDVHDRDDIYLEACNAYVSMVAKYTPRKDIDCEFALSIALVNIMACLVTSNNIEMSAALRNANILLGICNDAKDGSRYDATWEAISDFLDNGIIGMIPQSQANDAISNIVKYVTEPEVGVIYNRPLTAQVETIMQERAMVKLNSAKKGFAIKLCHAVSCIVLDVDVDVLINVIDGIDAPDMYADDMTELANSKRGEIKAKISDILKPLLEELVAVQSDDGIKAVFYAMLFILTTGRDEVVNDAFIEIWSNNNIDTRGYPEIDNAVNSNDLHVTNRLCRDIMEFVNDNTGSRQYSRRSSRRRSLLN